MAKIIVRDLTLQFGQPQINEMIIPNSSLCQIVVVHDDGTQTLLFSGKEIDAAMSNCDCPNIRCGNKKNAAET